MLVCVPTKAIFREREFERLCNKSLNEEKREKTEEKEKKSKNTAIFIRKIKPKKKR